MFLKLIGGAMVILSCSMIGFIIAASYKQRPDTLRNLQAALSMMESEINYGQTPMPEALSRVAKNCEGEVSELFRKTKTHITSHSGFTPSEGWEMALKDFSMNTALKQVDIEILSAFGKYLGSTDRDDQIKKIELAIAGLKQQETIALEEKIKNEKLWKYLGVLSGIMFFLLLY
ncbi:MAG TPA: stage III sporulation protein AB [Thermoanaerobacterales bacterium]|nr:stage III sporulation protein AB [Thermoanaerobacterales bacterium]